MPVAFGGQSQQRWGDGTLNANEYMRDFFINDLNGKTCGTADARKKGALVVGFVKIGEAASEQMIPILQKLADLYKEGGKLTVWVLAQGTPESARDMVERLQITFPILMDYDGYHGLVYGVTTYPTVVFAGQDGLIKRKVVGFKGRALNEVSDMAATVAGVEPVPLIEGEPMPPRPAPPAPAIEGAGEGKTQDPAPAGHAPATPATATKG